MKLLLPLLFLSLTMTGQGDFKVVDGNIIWQRVFESEMSSDQIFNAIVKHPHIIVEHRDTSFITGSIGPITPDYTACGYSVMSIPIYLGNSDIKGSFTIDIKKSKYRVTLSGLKLEATTEVEGLYEYGHIWNLKEMALKKSGAFTRIFLKKPSTVYNRDFQRLFTFKVEEDSDW